MIASITVHPFSIITGSGEEGVQATTLLYIHSETGCLSPFECGGSCIGSLTSAPHLLRLALAQAQVRGWLSYSDLVSIWEWVDINQTMALAASHTARTIATSTAMYLMCVTAVFATSSSLQLPAAVNEVSVPSADFSPADYIVYHSSHLQDVAPRAYNPALPHTYPHIHSNFHQDWGPDVMNDVVTKQWCPWQQLKDDADPQIFPTPPVIRVNQNSNIHKIHSPPWLDVQTGKRNWPAGGGQKRRCIPLGGHLFTHSNWSVVTPGTAVC